jgi:hypothetical protein
MDAVQHLPEMVAAAAGAATVAAIVVVFSVVGGPRRRLALAPDGGGGRVRLASRTLERLAIVVALLALSVICLFGPMNDPLLLVAVWCTVGAIVMAARRGGFEGLVPADIEDVAEDDGYVDAEPRRGGDG